MKSSIQNNSDRQSNNKVLNTQSLSRAGNQEKSSEGSLKERSSQPSSLLSSVSSLTLGGFSVPEIAVLGAAGFVVWKNRERILSLLEQNGIEVPEVFSGNISNLIQTGVEMLNNKSNSSKMHDA